MSKNFLEINNVTFAIGGKNKVNDVNITIANEGDIICILGPSGIGKTTMLRTIAGLEQINQGEIIVVEETKELLKKMGHKKLTVELQDEISKIPQNLEKYGLVLGNNKMSVDYTYSVQGEQTGITNLLKDLKDAGLKLKDLKTEQSTLEKIFVSLVKENNEI